MALRVESQKTNLVGKYFTPLAVLIVANGVILTRPPSPINEICLGLLVFSIFLNLVSKDWIDRAEGGWQLNIRIVVNLGVNISLVYLLGPYWKPIWLLLLLTPIATAIYGSQNKTIVYSLFSTAVLVFFATRQSGITPIQWAEQVTYGLFIILLSVAIYQLSQIKSQSKKIET